MTDEIDLLRLFRDDTPGPDAAAWERAQRAIAEASKPAMAGEAGMAAASEVAVAGEAAASRRLEQRDSRRRRVPGRRLPGRRVTITTAVALVVAVAAALSVGVMQGPPTLSKPLATAWQPARPLPGSATGTTAPAGTWRLASYLMPHGWQENTAGPEPGPLTCPTARTCYVEGDNASSASGQADMNTFYVSADGGQGWSVLPVPAHVTFTSPLSCAADADCAAGGLYYGHQPVYLSTANGGHSWTVTPLPGGTGTVYQLDCAAPGTCQGLASAAGADPGDQLIRDARFITITAGGGRVSATAFPAGVSVQDVSCPTAAECVAAGIADKGIASLSDPVVLVSRDDGASWRRSALPAAFDLTPYPAQVTCVDAVHCRMLGYTGDLNRYVNVTLHEDGAQTEQVQDAYSVVGFSDDGGMTWRASTFPNGIPFPRMNYLACPTVTTCYAAGSALIPQRTGNQAGVGWNEDTPVVAITHDSGRTWQRVTFHVPGDAPGSMLAESFIAIGTIQCPQADACVATGVSAQGSASTPVYANHG